MGKKLITNTAKNILQNSYKNSTKVTEITTSIQSQKPTIYYLTTSHTNTTGPIAIANKLNTIAHILLQNSCHASYQTYLDYLQSNAHLQTPIPSTWRYPCPEEPVQPPQYSHQNSQFKTIEKTNKNNSKKKPSKRPKNFQNSNQTTNKKLQNNQQKLPKFVSKALIQNAPQIHQYPSEHKNYIVHNTFCLKKLQQPTKSMQTM